jgi:tRNA pseudouridine55 synthase
VLLVDKPAGPTSHDVVARIRRTLGVRRVGHAGTLDPFASGLLLVLVGRATRLSRFLVGMDKSYDGEIVLGIETTTHDVAGTVVQRDEGWRGLDDDRVREGMAGLVGTIEQVPPVFSAKHVDGQRAYRLARRGDAPELAPEQVTVSQFALTARQGQRVAFETEVGSGTYVRALARDLGRRLGCGAYLGTLRRSAIGPFHVDDAVSMADVDVTRVRTPLDAVQHLARIDVDASQRDLVVHGRALEVPSGATGNVAVVYEGRLVAVATGAGDVLKPRVVLGEGT